MVCEGRENVVCEGREIGLNDNALSNIHFARQPQKNGTYAYYSISPQIRSKPARITCDPARTRKHAISLQSSPMSLSFGHTMPATREN